MCLPSHPPQLTDSTVRPGPAPALRLAQKQQTTPATAGTDSPPDCSHPKIWDAPVQGTRTNASKSGLQNRPRRATTRGTYSIQAPLRGFEPIRCHYPGSGRTKSIQGRARLFLGLLSCLRRRFSYPIPAASQGRSRLVATALGSGRSSRVK